MCAQIVHAAGYSVRGPVPEETNAVVLAVTCEEALLGVSAHLTRAGIQHHLVREPDAPWNNQATAIGIPPMPKNCIRPFLSSLPLLREKPKEAPVR